LEWFSPYVAIATIIALESMSVPLPGETVLVLASLFASQQHFHIVGVIAAAATGAVLGEFGYRLLRRYGGHLGLTTSKIKLGQYLFMRHGGKVVFFGRFVAVLRVLAAVLAGMKRWIGASSFTPMQPAPWSGPAPSALPRLYLGQDRAAPCWSGGRVFADSRHRRLRCSSPFSAPT
jgi:membrane protein DedA with SNARE-associated domain